MTSRYGKRRPGGSGREEATLRIIGGQFRGRKLRYSGDPRTRPMKERVREAVFNILGPDVDGKHAIDLFAGTGALGLEAASRGAVRLTFVERHFPTAELIRENLDTLELTDWAEVMPADTFIWVQRNCRHENLQGVPWLVFCSPPYDLYVTRQEAMLDLIRSLCSAAPEGSLMVVECDARFDADCLPAPADWHFRDYPPARVGIATLPLGDGTRGTPSEAP